MPYMIEGGPRFHFYIKKVFKDGFFFFKKKTLGIGNYHVANGP